MRANKILLIFASITLLLILVAFLVSLYGPENKLHSGIPQKAQIKEVPLNPHQVAAPLAQIPPQRLPAIHSNIPRRPEASTLPSPSRVDAAQQPAPSVARYSAPPVVPSEIENETDPTRKAELMKMHRLATARVRVSTLKHRESLLRNTIAKAKREGIWSAEKMKAAETDLQDLHAGIIAAKKELDHVRQEVGGDIDKDSK